jgi:hypothetical protein
MYSKELLNDRKEGRKDDEGDNIWLRAWFHTYMEYSLLLLLRELQEHPSDASQAFLCCCFFSSSQSTIRVKPTIFRGLLLLNSTVKRIRHLCFHFLWSSSFGRWSLSLPLQSIPSSCGSFHLQILYSVVCRLILWLLPSVFSLCLAFPFNSWLSIIPGVCSWCTDSKWTRFSFHNYTVLLYCTHQYQNFLKSHLFKYGMNEEVSETRSTTSLEFNHKVPS